jgi:hypothetical protein
MTSNPSNGNGDKNQRHGKVNFGVWTAVVFIGHAVGATIFVGLAGLALNLPAHKLLLPYGAMLYCGLVLSPLLYWVRLAREQPKSCAIRLALSMFLYSQVLMLTLGFSTIRLGILSQEAATGYALPVLVLSALASVLLYIFTRQMLQGRKA